MAQADVALDAQKIIALMRGMQRPGAYYASDARNIDIAIRVMMGERQTDIAREYGLSVGRVAQIVAKVWRHTYWMLRRRGLRGYFNA